MHETKRDMNYAKQYGTDPFYESRRWKKLRGSILKRDGYIDQIEKRYGRMKEATIVHHVFPREFFPSFELERWNLISVSMATHNRLHDRNSKKLTREGVLLAERVWRKQFGFASTPPLQKML